MAKDKLPLGHEYIEPGRGGGCVRCGLTKDLHEERGEVTAVATTRRIRIEVTMSIRAGITDDVAREMVLVALSSSKDFAEVPGRITAKVYEDSSPWTAHKYDVSCECGKNFTVQGTSGACPHCGTRRRISWRIAPLKTVQPKVVEG